MGFNSSKSAPTFYENVTTIEEISTSTMHVISDESSMNLEFVCDGTFSAKIYAKVSEKGTFKPYPSFELPSYNLITDTITDDSFIYNIDLTGVEYIKIVLVSLTGTISVYGKVVG